MATQAPQGRGPEVDGDSTNPVAGGGAIPAPTVEEFVFVQQAGFQPLGLVVGGAMFQTDDPVGEGATPPGHSVLARVLHADWESALAWAPGGCGSEGRGWTVPPST